MTLADSYGILGLKPGADKNTIREAYRNLAKKYHPDINNSRDAGDKFILVKRAYDKLLNAGEGDLQYAHRPATKAEFYEQLYKEKLKERQAPYPSSRASTPAGNAYTGYRPFGRSKPSRAKTHSTIYYFSRYFALILIALTFDMFIERNFALFIVLALICLPSAFYILKWTKSIE